MKILGFNIGRAGATAPRNESTPASVSPPIQNAVQSVVTSTGGAGSAGISIAGGEENRGEGSLARAEREKRFMPPTPSSSKGDHFDTSTPYPAGYFDYSEDDPASMVTAIRRLLSTGKPEDRGKAFDIEMALEKFKRKDGRIRQPSPIIQIAQPPTEDPRVVKFRNAPYEVRGHVGVQPSFILELLKRAGVPYLLTPEQKTLLRQLTEENNGYLAELSEATHEWVVSEWARMVSENQRAAEKGETLPHNVPLRDQMHILAEQRRFNIRGKMRSVCQRRFDLIYKPALEKLQEISLEICEKLDAAEREAQFTGTGLPFQPSPSLKIVAWFASQGVRHPISSFVAGTVDIMGTRFLSNEVLMGDEIATIPAKLKTPENVMARQMLANQKAQKEALAAKGIKA